MNTSVFLSHNHRDKPFVRRLARDLENHGVKYWLDEAEMKVGDSLIQKIREGIDNVNYFAVILSPNSIDAPWVNNELDVAMNHQISGKKIKVLPIMLKECEPPGFLIGKAYADFQDEEKYEDSFKFLINSIDIVFNQSVMSLEKNEKTIGAALNKALYKKLFIMGKPFHRPFQYMGMTIQQAEQSVGTASNEAGNIVVENEECYMLLEAEGNFIHYVEVSFKRTAPHNLNEEFDSEPILGALSISLSVFELVRKQMHYHAYYDHRKRLKISVSCSYDGAPLTVMFSSKYYGM